jgi:hypothetical protein
MLTLVLAISGICLMDVPVQAATLAPHVVVRDSDLHEYEIRCRLLASRSDEEPLCVIDWRCHCESESLNIKSEWLPRQPFKMALGSNEAGAPVLWIEFSARRTGGLG